MGRRKTPRTDVNLRVKLWGTDSAGQPFIESAATRNVSSTGLSVQGIKRALQVGDAVGLTYREQKGRFRVTWVGQPGTADEGLVGLENISKSDDFWGFALPGSGADPYQSPARAERRQFRRLDCDLGVELRLENSSAPVRGRLADLSLGGCYVETSVPLVSGTKLDLVFWLGEEKITSSGIVICSDPSFGVGVKFVGMSKTKRDRMESYLDQQATPPAQRASRLKRPTPSGRALCGGEPAKPLH